MTLGERITNKRKEKGFSQEYLAQYIGVSRQAVHKWEKDLSAPDTYNLIALAQVLDTTVEYIVKGDENNPIPRTIAKRKLPKWVSYVIVAVITAVITFIATIIFISNAPVAFDAGACGGGFETHIFDKYSPALTEKCRLYIENIYDKKVISLSPVRGTQSVDWKGKSIYMSYYTDVQLADNRKVSIPLKFVGERKWIEIYDWTMVQDISVTEKEFIAN